MGTQKLKALVIDDEPDFAELTSDVLLHLGVDNIFATDADEAERLLEENQFDFVLSDIHIPKHSGIQIMQRFRAKVRKMPIWVFMSGDPSPLLIEGTAQAGAFDVLQKPFTEAHLADVIKRIQGAGRDPIEEIMRLIQSISGVQLGSEKRMSVETRLFRRARLLGLPDIETYARHFRDNPETEVRELISLITTHTTEFFREHAHFDYLYDNVFPALLDKPTVKVWSAASSTGEELYSLAIAWHEFVRERKPTRVPKVEFHGTDIDFLSVEKARDGVFQKSSLRSMDPALVERYFDVGEGELADFVRVKDEIHARCRFEQMNLLTRVYPQKDMDVVFLRNVLIYFKPDDVQNIAERIKPCLAPGGYLFLGHSESLMNLKTSFTAVGNAIYRIQDRSGTAPVAARDFARPAFDRPIRVMIVDDSRPIRMTLRKILTAEHGFEVVAEASNPLEAEEFLKTTKPDLMTLDIHMPEMDGITYLERLSVRGNQFPVVMISSISYQEAVDAFRCFEIGAVDFIEKPKGTDLAADAERIRAVLKNAARAKRKTTSALTPSRADVIYSPDSEFQDLIVIGASTGGPEAIQRLLPTFPKETPPIVVIQHIPAAFSAAFARRLNEVSHIRCREAVDGEKLENSHLYLAPGGKQLKLVIAGKQIRAEVTDDPPVNRHQPSVDYTFQSLTAQKRRLVNVSAALLTGMGADGAKGLKSLRDWGAHTIAQDEDSCVVFGMPKEAIALDGADEVLSLMSIPHHLFRGLRRKSAA